jgi:hypothetical protein
VEFHNLVRIPKSKYSGIVFVFEDSSLTCLVLTWQQGQTNDFLILRNYREKDENNLHKWVSLALLSFRKHVKRYHSVARLGAETCQKESRLHLF